MEMVWMLLVFAFFLGLIILRRQALQDRDYFEKQGVMYLGNRSYAMLYQLLRGTTIEQNISEWYSLMAKKGQKIAGMKEFGVKVLTVTDPELLKAILIKDFDHFKNRREFEVPKEEVLFGKMIFALRDKEWKDLRSTITPVFTTGKIRRLFRLFKLSGDQCITYLEKNIQNASRLGDISQDTVEVDFVPIIGKYTIEIISTAVCGIQSKSFECIQPSVMEVMSGKLALEFGPLQTLKILLIMIFPIVANFFKMAFFNKESEAYFMWAIKQTIKNREDPKNKDKSWDDFIQLMIEGRRGTGKKDGDENGDKSGDTPPDEDGERSLEFLNDDYIVANCVLFILAGYDTTHAALLFGLYSLALNPDMQERLRKEIEEAVEHEALKESGFLTYDTLHTLKYLDMILNETLRLYPPTIMFDRGCTKDYQITPEYKLKKGEGVIIPLLPIHRDERYYPNAHKFDPERFSEENKSKISPYTYLPFGGGPRNCAGMRFALTEAKLGIAMLVYHFKLEPSANTPIPMTYKNGNMLKPKNGMKLNITKIPRSKPVPDNVSF